MKQTVVYIHGKGGTAAEAEHYKGLFPQSKVLGFDYKAQNPWQAREEFPPFLAELRADCDRLVLVANSIGAFFAMSALDATLADVAYLISPIVDMERLITDMMGWAGVTEAELAEKKEIVTPFGETLSWEYLCYVRAHPIRWKVPTHILYGEKDNLTAQATITAFASRTRADLTVMPGGEHWFHTPEQMDFLGDWMQKQQKT